jgi:phosphatidylserine/phosphatidylglycerophosphate/cardiolipin synthase-like enzyme
MDEIVAHLTKSIADELFSKEEKRSLKELVAGKALTPDQLNFLRSKVYELANEKATESNYRFILEWVRQANAALTTNPRNSSEAFFSPGESCRNSIIQQISRGISRLRICVFTISDDTITNAIVMAHKKGLDVKIITDNDKSLDLGSDVGRLAQEGIVVKMDNTSNHMHHKFMVVDEKMLLTGSYNWTQSAARFNHENIMLTTDEKTVRLFMNEFDRLWPKMDLYK